MYMNTRYLSRAVVLVGLLLSFHTVFISESVGQTPDDLVAAVIGGKTAETKSYSAELRFSDISATFEGDSLRVSYRLNIQGRVVGYDEALHVVPVYGAGHELYSFPPVLIQDGARNSYYRREMNLLDNETYLERRPYRLVVLDGARTRETVEYRYSLYIPREARKEGSTLKIYQFLQDCCDLREADAYEVPLTDGQVEEAPRVVELPPAAPVITPSDVRFLRPAAEAVKMREEHATVRIGFKVARHDILPTFGQNYVELLKVKELLSPLLSGRPGDIEVEEASIRGYASPEGGFEYNRNLSQRRADSFKNYLLNRYGSLRGLSSFSAMGLGEDWEGLRKSVEEHSAVPMRSQVLAIIDFVDLYSGREKQLMDLGGGVPYNYMLEHLFPALRRMEMEVRYRVRSYRPEEVGRIYDSRPQDLSQEEIYEVAQRRNDASTPRHLYGLEYAKAAKYFPEDRIANLNASSAALVRGDLKEAWTYLSRLVDAPEATNNLGLYYWLKGDLPRAEAYFKRSLRDPAQAEKARDFLRRLASDAAASGSASSSAAPHSTSGSDVK